MEPTYDEVIALYDTLRARSNGHGVTDDGDVTEDPWIDWTTLGEREDALITNLAVPGRWTAVYSPAKAGKSALLTWATVKRSSGVDVFGDGSGDPVHVGYLDAENGRMDVHERLTAVIQVDVEELSHWHYTDDPPQLDNERGAAALMQWVDRYELRIVLIDGINGVVTGDEKDDAAWRAFYRHTIGPLKARGVAVITADNAGKDLERGPRGNSVKLDKPDAIVQLTRRDGEHLAYKVTHARDRSTFRNMTLSVVGLGDDEGIEPVRYWQATGGTVPEGTAELIAELDRLGVAPNAGRPTARKALTEAGISVRNAVLEAAVRYRKRASGTAPVSAFGQSADLDRTASSGNPESPDSSAAGSTGSSAAGTDRPQPYLEGTGTGGSVEKSAPRGLFDDDPDEVDP